MAWITPKTNWAATMSGDVYTGDFFTNVDFNRIKNNLQELSDLGAEMFIFNFTSTLPSSKTTTGYPYASEFNAMETRLDEINQQSIRIPIGVKKIFSDNGAFIDAAELNRIESAMLSLYQSFTNITGGRKMLRFRLGFPSESIKF